MYFIDTDLRLDCNWVFHIKQIPPEPSTNKPCSNVWSLGMSFRPSGSISSRQTLCLWVRVHRLSHTLGTCAGTQPLWYLQVSLALGPTVLPSTRERICNVSFLPRLQFVSRHFGLGRVDAQQSVIVHLLLQALLHCRDQRRPAFTCTNDSSVCHGSILCSNFDHGARVHARSSNHSAPDFLWISQLVLKQSSWSAASRTLIWVTQFWSDCASQLLHRSGVFSTFPIVCQDPSITRMQPPSGMLDSLTDSCRWRRTLCNFSQQDIHRDCRSKLHNSDTSDLDLLACLSLSSTSGGSFSATILKAKLCFQRLVPPTPSVHGCSSGASSPAPSPGGNSSTTSLDQSCPMTSMARHSLLCSYSSPPQEADPFRAHGTTVPPHVS